MDELRSRFLFNEESPAQKLYYDKKQKAISFTKESNKKNSTVAEEENQFFGEILPSYDTRILNLRYIMNWSVTNKPCLICSEDGKVNKANKKFTVFQ